MCCRMTPLQTELYKCLIQSKVLRMELTAKSKSGSGMSASSLAFITQLKKLTNRKYLIYSCGHVQTVQIPPKLLGIINILLMLAYFLILCLKLSVLTLVKSVLSSWHYIQLFIMSDLIMIVE